MQEVPYRKYYLEALEAYDGVAKFSKVRHRDNLPTNLRRGLFVLENRLKNQTPWIASEGMHLDSTLSLGLKLGLSLSASQLNIEHEMSKIDSPSHLNFAKAFYTMVLKVFPEASVQQEYFNKIIEAFLLTDFEVPFFFRFFNLVNDFAESESEPELLLDFAEDGYVEYKYSEDDEVEVFTYSLLTHLSYLTLGLTPPLVES